jgi:hypothetical protein
MKKRRTGWSGVFHLCPPIQSIRKKNAVKHTVRRIRGWMAQTVLPQAVSLIDAGAADLLPCTAGINPHLRCLSTSAAILRPEKDIMAAVEPRG